MNIVSDRGSNFVKAFSIYNPIYCFGHRLNNILKICFFQQDNKSKRNCVSISSKDSARTTQSSVVLDSLVDGNLSDDSESESSECGDEYQELNLGNEKTWITFKKEKSNGKMATEKISVEDISDDAKKILVALRKTNRIVKYVKKSVFPML